MIYQMETITGAIPIQNLLPESGKTAVVAGIFEGLANPQKSISSVFFYDEKGSRLFEKITRLPEYYLTRTEKQLIKQCAENLPFELNNMEIIELGSGDCGKISLFLSSIPDLQAESITYTPVDVSLSAILDSGKELQKIFPDMKIRGILADFLMQAAKLPKNNKKRLFCFFGSTIGNLSSQERTVFIRDIGKGMRPGEYFIVGVDLVKDRKILEEAYNDSRGITAQFNKNILTSINRIALTDFDPLSFEHLAFYNDTHNKIEMHLRSTEQQMIRTPYLKEELTLMAGETIHTENSHKFTPSHIQELTEPASLSPAAIYTDSKNWFSLFLLRKNG